MELLPCPFCGGKVEIAGWDYGWTGGFEIDCKSCRLSMGSAQTLEAAADAWNHRAHVCRDGWALVPNELTEEMRLQGFASANGKLGARAMYRAMIAAAPTPEDKS